MLILVFFGPLSFTYFLALLLTFFLLAIFLSLIILRSFFFYFVFWLFFKIFKVNVAPGTKPFCGIVPVLLWVGFTLGIFMWRSATLDASLGLQEYSYTLIQEKY